MMGDGEVRLEALEKGTLKLGICDRVRAVCHFRIEGINLHPCSANGDIDHKKDCNYDPR